MPEQIIEENPQQVINIKLAALEVRKQISKEITALILAVGGSFITYALGIALSAWAGAVCALIFTSLSIMLLLKAKKESERLTIKYALPEEKNLLTIFKAIKEQATQK